MRKNLAVHRYDLGIVIILTAYLVLGAYYSVTTPILEASDEISHYPFVKLLADGKGLPIQQPVPEDNVARQEGSQPPLYYALAAAATFWIDTGDANALVWLNPHAKVGIPLAHGNKNMVIHGPQEDFPYHGPALAVHVIRWLTLLMGVATIICVYRIARLIYPSRRSIALAAAALVAFSPEFNFISASVNNDNLMTLLASVIVLTLISYVKTGITYRRSCVLGVILGLALLSKLTGLGLIPLIFACLALICWRQRSLTRFIHHAIIVSVIASLIAGWWYVRNWLLYGDPTGLSMMLKIVGIRVPTPGIFDLLSEFQGFRISFWGLFGGVNVIGDEWIYQLLDGASILALLGLVLSVSLFFIDRVSSARSTHEGPILRSIWREAKGKASTMFGNSSVPVPSSVLVLIPSGWLLINFGLFMRWTQTTLASQGRLIFPAISGAALLFAIGWAALVPRRISWLPLSIMVAFLLGFSALAPALYIAPAYATPPMITEKDIPAGIQRVDFNFGQMMRLVGYRLDQQQVSPGGKIGLTLYWQVMTTMEKDFSIFIHVYGKNGQTIAQEDTYPGLGTLATRLLKPGDVFAETHLLSIRAAAEAPSLARLAVGMYYLPTMTGLATYDSNMKPLRDILLLAEIKLGGRTPYPMPTHPITMSNFDNIVELVGYDLDTTTVNAGGKIDLTLYWRALQKTGDDYTVFTQLLSENQSLYGQHDSQPVGAYYPTHLWDIGEVIADKHVIQVRADAPPGRYSLVTGMYSLVKNIRLTLLDQNGQNYISIPDIIVNAPK